MICEKAILCSLFIWERKYKLMLSEIYSAILKNSLRTYKYRNSTMKPAGHIDSSRNGAIFAYRSKQLMNAGRGMVITSEEAILENEQKLTHWTPNAYRFGTYADEYRTIVKGHSEKNLSQINTFIVDIDSKENHQGEIILACIDQVGYMPTLILESDHGYQIYFVLKTPGYVTKKSNFKVIDVAKKISKTIRLQLAKQLSGIDLGCNHFGIARFPHNQNIVFQELNYQYAFNDWIQWSMKIESDQKTQEELERKVVVFPEKKEIRQVDEPWFDMLLHTDRIRGKKGIMGRNNVIMTLSLAYFSSGYSMETCEYNMREFNERLAEPLSDSELQLIIKKAFSGKYQAASRYDYIIPLCKEWVSSELEEKDLFHSRRGWWKFKKPRTQRKYSHKREWKEDLMAYLSEKSKISTPYLVLSKKVMVSELGIPKRTLDKVLQELKGENEIFYQVKSGRNGGMIIASVKTLFGTIIQAKKEMKQTYIAAITNIFDLTESFVQETFKQLTEPLTQGEEIKLFELDTG